MATAFWIATYLGLLIWSGISPQDRFTWFLEVLPAVAALPVLAATRRRFPLTPLGYVLVLVYAAITMVGAHYTYPEVPFFDRLQEWLDLSRNHYDRLGHFAQGLVPAVIVREILRRKRLVNGRRSLALLVVCVCLAISAFYELIEWGVAAATGEAAEAFLATQGDPWDSQADMLSALVGALVALAVFSRIHDHQIAEIEAR